MICDVCHADEALADSTAFAAATDDGFREQDELRVFAFGSWGFFQVRLFRGWGERLLIALGVLAPRHVPSDRR